MFLEWRKNCRVQFVFCVWGMGSVNTAALLLTVFCMCVSFVGLLLSSLWAGLVSTSALCHHRKREPQPGGRGPHPSCRYRLPHQQTLQVYAKNKHKTQMHDVFFLTHLISYLFILQVHWNKTRPCVSVIEVRGSWFYWIQAAMDVSLSLSLLLPHPLILYTQLQYDIFMSYIYQSILILSSTVPLHLFSPSGILTLTFSSDLSA